MMLSHILRGRSVAFMSHSHQAADFGACAPCARTALFAAWLLCAETTSRYGCVKRGQHTPTHREVRETRRRRDAAAEHLSTTTPGACPVHQPDARCPLVGCGTALRHAPLVPPRHARAHTQ